MIRLRQSLDAWFRVASRTRLTFSARGPAIAGVLLLIALLVIALGTVGIARADTRPRGDTLQRQAEAAKARAAEARAQEQALAGGISAQSERIDAIESDIGVLRGELARMETKLGRSRSLLADLQARLAEKTRALERAREQAGFAQQRLSARIVAIYTSDEPDALAVALAADSLDDLMEILEVRARVVEQDTGLVEEIGSLRSRVTRERARTKVLERKRAAETARLQTTTSERRATVTALVVRRDSLKDLRSARQRSLASVQVERRDWEAQADALEAESARLAAVIAAAPPPPPAPAPTPDVAAPAPTPTSAPTPPVSAPAATGFIWPVRGTVVSPFGQRWGRLHAGIDIAAPAGTPIAASSSGQVIYAGSMSGYGLLVVVQHAGGIATAYAHNSSISVSVGQSVAQGQTIAAVGCTGSCYGDHVHFEIRVGGSPVDPMGYL